MELPVKWDGGIEGICIRLERHLYIYIYRLISVLILVIKLACYVVKG